MKKVNLTLIGAVVTALLSTLCCLPAFLFLFFGITSSFLTILTSLDYLRIPFAILSGIFLFYGLKKYSTKLKCECKKRTLISFFFIMFVFVLFVFLLFYPELIPIFLD